VKDIVVNLAKFVGVQKDDGSDAKKKEGCIWDSLPVERFLEDESESRASTVVVPGEHLDLFTNNSIDGQVDITILVAILS